MLLLAALYTWQQTGVPNDSQLRHPGETNLVNIRQLTFGGQNAEAYWNKEGTKLIFQSLQKEWPDEQILTMNADGSNKRLVSSGLGRCTCSYFVPGTDEVVFSATSWKDPGAQPKPDMSKGYVWVVNPNFRVFRSKSDGTQSRLLINSEGYTAESTIDPNGKFITFTSTMHGDIEIYRCDLNGKNIKRLTNEAGYDGGPFVSWDGKKIVYRRDRIDSEGELNEYRDLLKQNMVRPGKLEIWVMDADGKNKRQVTNLNCASFAPFMLPNGKQIIFSSNHGDPKGREFDLFLINVDGTGLKRITYTPEFDGFPMLTRDGKRLVWASNRNAAIPGETNIFVADWKE